MGKLIKDLEIDPREIAVITPYREPVKMSKETIESRLDSNLGSILREALIRDLVFWLKEEYGISYYDWEERTWKSIPSLSDFIG